MKDLAEDIIRTYRGYILPSYRKTFGEVVSLGKFRVGDERRQFIFFDFSSSRIDLDAGRYAFALVRDFEEAGYTACYRASFPFLSSMRYKRYKELLLERDFRVCDSPEKLPVGTLGAVVTDRKSVQLDSAKLLRISYDYRLPSGRTEVVMPFRVYPKLYSAIRTLREIEREQPRPWRVFFAGSVTERYGRDVLEEKFGKMSRLAILKTLKTKLESSEHFELNSMLDSAPKNPAFVVASAKFRVPQEEWFRTLGKADFFFACPGGSMPICHNLPEAMAAGAIPILEYPEYLNPELRDGKNCLTFSGERELLTTMQRAFQMKGPQILAMRRAAQEYYQRHLAPGLFAREIMASPFRELTLLFNAAHVRR